MPRRSESGNAVVIILVGIVLFAGLAYTFMRGAESGTGNLMKGQINIASQEIINNSSLMVKAIDRIRQKGCSELEINFYSTDTETSFFYAPNPAAPADKHCDVFDPAGGGLSVWKIPQNYSTGATGFNIQPKSFLDVQGTPTNKTDLVIMYTELNKDICLQINKTLGIDADADGNPPSELLGVWAHDYTIYNTNGDDGLGNEVGATNNGKTAACFQWGATDNYIFYQTLIEN